MNICLLDNCFINNIELGWSLVICHSNLVRVTRQNIHSTHLIKFEDFLGFNGTFILQLHEGGAFFFMLLSFLP